jgi:hypothetical protein
MNILSSNAQNQFTPEEALQEYLTIHPLLPKSSNRICDWRWQLAHYLPQHPYLKKEFRKDEALKTAWQLKKYLDYLERIGYRRPRRKAPPESVMRAYDLYCRSIFSQTELKARLLAEEPISDIAKKIGVSQETVEWYERLFFNVSDRLRAVGYITHRIIDLSRLNRNHPQFLDAFLLEMGYCGGPFLVDFLVKHKHRIAEPFSQYDLMPSQDAEEAIIRRVKLFIEVRSSIGSPPDRQTGLDIRGMNELAHREKLLEKGKTQLESMHSLTIPFAELAENEKKVATNSAIYRYIAYIPIAARKAPQKIAV